LADIHFIKHLQDMAARKRGGEPDWGQLDHPFDQGQESVAEFEDPEGQLVLFEGEAEAASPGFVPVPYIFQGTRYSCGASALQGVLMFWGKEYKEAELMRMLETDPQDGTSPEKMIAVAQSLGFNAEFRENLALADLEASLLRGIPPIVAAQVWRDPQDLNKPWPEVWESGHYLVLVGMDEMNLYFEDPSLLGSRGFIPRQEFLERWHDQVDERKFYNGAIFIEGGEPSPPPPLVRI